MATTDAARRASCIVSRPSPQPISRTRRRPKATKRWISRTSMPAAGYGFISTSRESLSHESGIAQEAPGQGPGGAMLRGPGLPDGSRPPSHGIGVADHRASSNAGLGHIEHGDGTNVPGTVKRWPGGVRFAHPLVRASNLESIPASLQGEKQADQ